MTDIKKGDRVKVAIEGEVTLVTEREFQVGTGAFASSLVSRIPEGHTATIEKIEPPVEEFGLGDRIRHRDAGFQVTICKGGYLVHHSTGEHSWSPWSPTPGQFTSEYYDKVFIE